MDIQPGNLEVDAMTEAASFKRTDGRLRVLHLIMSLRSTNGQYIEHCLPRMHEWDIAICSFFKASLKPPPEIALFEGDGTIRGFWRVLRRALDSGHYDVVHAHSPQTGTALVVVKLMRRTSGARAVCTVQNSFNSYSFRNGLLLIPVFALAPRVVLCSTAALESMPGLLRRLGGRRVMVIRNGVDIDRVRRVLAKTRDDTVERPFTVVSVGRLIARKNPLMLMRAFERSQDPAARLVYVGDGEDRARLIDEANQLRMSARVMITGLVDRDDVYRHVAQADVCVSVSRAEGLPVAVLESMACGRPVILSDIPPHREIVGDVGFIPLVDVDDLDGLAHELRCFREMRSEERSDIGARCKALAENRFSLAAMQESYEAIYRKS